MDTIQKVLVKAGRKDLAQKYYKKIVIAGQSDTKNFNVSSYEQVQNYDRNVYMLSERLITAIKQLAVNTIRARESGQVVFDERGFKEDLKELKRDLQTMYNNAIYSL